MNRQISGILNKLKENENEIKLKSVNSNDSIRSS